MTVLLDLDHETGDLTQYDASSVGSPEHLTVAQAAGLAGTNYGLSFQIADTTNHYARKDVSTSTTGKLRLRFYLDPNGLTMGNAEGFAVMYCAADAGTTYILYVSLNYTTAQGYAIKANAYIDTGSTSATGAHAITDAPHYIELYLQRATNSTSNDGSFQLWIDGVSKETLSGLDNYDRFSAFVRTFVCCNSLDAGTSGTFYLDELVVNNDGTLIGPVAAGGTAVPVFMNQYRFRRN